MRDLCLTDDFSDSEVVLMDIEERRAEAMRRLAHRYAEELRSGPRLLQALSLDPYTRTAEQAEAYLDDVAQIEKEHVPWLG